MDQCGNCTLKGDLTNCKETPCSHHETWYATTQQKRIDELEAVIKVLTAPLTIPISENADPKIQKLINKNFSGLYNAG